MQYSASVLLGLCAALVAVIALVVRHLNRSALSRLPGPTPESFLLGNQMQYEKSDVGDIDLKWFRVFGHTFRFKGGWGENVLYTSDPKAMQYILQTSAYGFEKSPILLLLSRGFLGNGILSVEHDEHKRHRKVMLPAFALPQTKALTPVFQSAAASLIAYLNMELASNKDGVVVNIHTWMAKATLDAIGEAAFGGKFGALDESDNKLSRNFRDLLLRSRGGAPSNGKAIMTNTIAVLPVSLGYILSKLQRTRNRVQRENLVVTHELGKELLHKKMRELALGDEEKDVMSLLVKSNSVENPKTNMSEEEMLGGVSAVMLAGHETTATSATFALWELAKVPALQETLRSEIRRFYQAALDRGEDSIPVSDYEQMEYTQAVVKETLRFRPLVPFQTRHAAKDDMVPLSHPVTTKDGILLHELPLKKGTRILLSLAQYNRLEEIWGPDAQSYNPNRWLNKDQKEAAVKFGVYANLGTFGAGIHACIGWRFAVYELQTFLIELVNNFRFELTPEAETVRMAWAGISVPLVKGQDHAANMPLRIFAAK